MTRLDHVLVVPPPTSLISEGNGVVVNRYSVFAPLFIRDTQGHPFSFFLSIYIFVCLSDLSPLNNRSSSRARLISLISFSIEILISLRSVVKTLI